MILIVSKEEKELVKRLRALEPVGALSEEIIKLKREIVGLEVTKSKAKEEHDKQERELRHMIGLEKKRQEVEIEQAKRETTLKVREENLKAEREQFEKNLKFNTERFEAMEAYLKGMMTDILARLPNVNVELKKLGR
jgi:hypothetical protein